MDGRIGPKRNKINTKFTKRNKRQDVVEGHECLRPEGVHKENKLT